MCCHSREHQEVSGGRAGLLIDLSYPVGLSVMLSETRLPGKSGHLQVHCDSRCPVADSSLSAGPVSAPLLSSQINLLLFLLFKATLRMRPPGGRAGSLGGEAGVPVRFASRSSSSSSVRGPVPPVIAVPAHQRPPSPNQVDLQ